MGLVEGFYTEFAFMSIHSEAVRWFIINSCVDIEYLDIRIARNLFSQERPELVYSYAQDVGLPDEPIVSELPLVGITGFGPTLLNNSTINDNPSNNMVLEMAKTVEVIDLTADEDHGNQIPTICLCPRCVPDDYGLCLTSEKTQCFFLTKKVKCSMRSSKLRYLYLP